QADFFKKTTLPLVKSLLSGSSGLIFTYGVTNSGKSYTVQGVPGEGGAGILPRTVDVIFNSIDGLQSESDLRPKGYSGVERMAASPTEDAAQGNMGSGINPYAFRSFARMLQKADSASQLFPADGLAQWEKEKCKIQVDRNWRYSIWVSYVEIYKERIFDLLDVDPTDQSGSRFASSFSISNLASASSGHFSSDGRRQIAFDRAPLSLVKDPETGNKYVHGAREIRVRNAEEARSLIVRGGQNRAMFATATNSTSSRSHAIFTLRVVREHGSMKQGDTSDVTTARLSIVDLAGSERQANSKTEQPQLKEAGQINHGLVCLGQCLKALRKNQARAAASVQALNPIASARMEARRRPSIVPFNHSKLTEVFSSFFTGDGQAVMILNLNPHTEYRENHPVLEMSACVQDVSTSVRTNPQLLVVHPNIARRAELFSHSQSNLAGGDMTSAQAQTQTQTHAQIRKQQPSSHQNKDLYDDEDVEITIVEGQGAEDEDEEGVDPFVAKLKEKYEEMYDLLCEAEERLATIESDVRAEMADEMTRRLQEMELAYSQRLLADAEDNENFVNRKIDLLLKANRGAGASGIRSSKMAPAETPGRKQERRDAEEVEATLAVSVSLKCIKCAPRLSPAHTAKAPSTFFRIGAARGRFVGQPR
ncbi:P-loop containing nucleoside triphosphate hydrolase protein, partial [Ceraceosorus guamensis]